MGRSRTPGRLRDRLSRGQRAHAREDQGTDRKVSRSREYPFRMRLTLFVGVAVLLFGCAGRAPNGLPLRINCTTVLWVDIAATPDTGQIAPDVLVHTGSTVHVKG